MMMETIRRFCLCDGVVSLSECGNMFTKAFSNHTRCIMNPISISLTEKTGYESHELIWCGRLSPEKQSE